MTKEAGGFMDYRIESSEFETFFKRILKDNSIFAPVRKKNHGNYSDTDLTTYDFISSFSDIDYSSRTYFSPKSVLLPVRETLFECEKNSMKQIIPDKRDIIAFLRPCDINSLKILDTIFLRNGACVDPYYSQKRDRLKIILMECKIKYEECFCVSMGTNRTDNYSMFVREKEDCFEVQIKDDGFLKYFQMADRSGTPIRPEFVESDLNGVDLPEDINDSVFTSNLWDEYSSRCIACGRCNTSCPTCSCFTIQNVRVENGSNNGAPKVERKRIWSSCQVKGFGLMARNHDFRLKNSERMRYKVMHKIMDFKRRAGFNMCVGCGRCEEVCPEYISMKRSIQKINHHISTDLEKENG